MSSLPQDAGIGLITVWTYSSVHVERCTGSYAHITVQELQCPSQTIQCTGVGNTSEPGCRGEHASALEDDKLAADASKEGWKAPDVPEASVADDVKPEQHLPATNPLEEVNINVVWLCLLS